MESERDDYTGKTRYRPSLFGCLILQIEVIEVRRRGTRFRYSDPKWRDAKASELDNLWINGVVR